MGLEVLVTMRELAVRCQHSGPGKQHLCHACPVHLES
jgi:hypothetical protein